jgi:ATP/maltotriose-dependent transcriptional regulator MalT
MNGNLMYEMARQRIAEQQRAARQAGEARERRAAARGRRAKAKAPEAIVTPAIPDFADEMFETARDTVPAPRTNPLPGGHFAGSCGEARKDRVLELWEQVPDAAAQIRADHVRVLEGASAAARDAAEPQRGLAYVELALTELDEAAEPVRVASLLRERFAFRKELGLGLSEDDLHRALALVPEDVSRSARTELLLAVSHCGIDTDGPQYRLWAADALRLAREESNLDAEAQALVNLAMIEAGPGQLATSDSEPFRLLTQARQIAQQASAYHPSIELMILETHLLCGAGEFERAARAGRRGIADAERHGLARTSGAFLAINLAEPLWYLGRWDEALGVTGRALDLAPPPGTRVGLWVVSGAIALARGDLAVAARRASASRAVLADRGYDAQHNLPVAKLDIDVALIGAGPLTAQIADLMRRAGSDGDADDPGLTSRELEVLRLVAAGQSNREIAAALVISPKTASVHVSNILGKLGAATRTEAAVKAHELGLLGILTH